MLEVNLETRRKVCREVRRLRPEVIVAPDPSRLWYGAGTSTAGTTNRQGCSR